MTTQSVQVLLRLDPARLTGRIVGSDPVSRTLKIVSIDDPANVVLKLEIRSNALPVVLEFLDFDDDTGKRWMFMAVPPWLQARGRIRRVFELWTEGETGEILTAIARPQTAAGDEDDEPSDIEIVVKPIVDAPDRS